MEPRTILRFEGIALFVGATAAYYTIRGPLWLFVVLALAPDLSMLGYLAGPRLGSRLYNAFHTYIGPATLGAGAAWLGMTPIAWVALVWAAHLGVDRALGYGLKYPTGFTQTHLTGKTDHPVPAVGGADTVPDTVGSRGD